MSESGSVFRSILDIFGHLAKVRYWRCMLMTYMYIISSTTGLLKCYASCCKVLQSIKCFRLYRQITKVMQWIHNIRKQFLQVKQSSCHSRLQKTVPLPITGMSKHIVGARFCAYEQSAVNRNSSVFLFWTFIWTAAWFPPDSWRERVV